jgi:putative transcriptional regulator
VKKIIRNNVKKFRLESQITQEDLALKVGVTRQTIGLIEKEKYNPTISLCLSLAKILKVTLNDLFWEEEEK